LRATTLLTLFLVVTVAVLAAWWGTHLIAYLDHRARFDGVCGPHAPDIPAHPCDIDRYLDEFDAGFAGVGLFMIKLAVCAVVVPVVTTITLVVMMFRRRKKKG